MMKTIAVKPVLAFANGKRMMATQLNDIVLLIVGGIGGIMGKRAVSAAVQTIYPKEEPDEPK